MKFRTLVWVFILGIALGCYFYGTALLKAWMEGALSKAAGRTVTIQSASLTFPLGVRLAGVAVPTLSGERAGSGISVKEMVVRLPLVSSLQGGSSLELELVEPRATLARSREGILTLPVAAGPAPGASKKDSGLPFSRLRIQGGKFTFIDQGIQPEVTWVLSDFSLDISPGPRLGSYLLAVSSSLESGSGEPAGKLQIQGELLPWATHEMKVAISHNRIWLLAPYIRPVLGTAPTQGSCALEMNLSFQEGKIIAQNSLTATGVSFQGEESTLLGPSGNKLVQLLSDPEGNIHLSFLVTGKLGEKLNWSDLTTAALREAMRQALAREIRNVLIDTEVKPLEEILRKGLESIGR